MFEVSFGELLLIGTVALIVLGPERLPKLARWIGKAVGTGKRIAAQARNQFEEDPEWKQLSSLQENIRDTWSSSVSDVQLAVHQAIHPTYNAPVTDVASSPSFSQDSLSMTASITDTAIPSFSQQNIPLVGVVMGSTSDWKYMKQAARMLKELGIPFEAKVVSAHRMPDAMFIYAATARQRGLKVIIAGAGGAAHLPGMLAAKTTVPVLGVPIPATLLNGQDALYSIVQMPKGIPVATFAIGEPGAANAGLFAASLLANELPELVDRLEKFRQNQTATVTQAVLDIEDL